ncbi:MAG: pitrilysin family protein, partial [Pseudomonadota bacterium]
GGGEMRFINEFTPARRWIAAGMLLCLCAAAGCKKKQGDDPMSDQIAEEKSPVKMRALTIPSKGADRVDIRILFNSGSVDDPEGKEGLTYMTAKMMAEGGTKKYAYHELIGLLYPMAADIDVSVDKEMTVFEGRVHRDHAGKYFPLLLQVLLEPRFAQDDFTRIKDETLNYIRKNLRQADDELLSKEALDVWIYEDHPYGHVVEGTVKGLESITLEDIKEHYNRIITRDRLTVGLAGAVDDELKTMVEDKLTGLVEKGAPAPGIPEPGMPEGIEVRIVEKTTDSTAIAMGVPVSLKRGHLDFYPLMLAFSCLGEHRQSMGRLFRTIREARGLNYGDYAYIEHFIQEGWTTKPMVNVARTRQEMSVWIRPVQNKHSLIALKLALFELKKFVEKGLTLDEFDRTKGFLMGYTRVLEESLARRLGYGLDDLFYKTPSHLSGARKAFETMTLKQVNDAIATNIKIDSLKIVIITQNGDVLKKQLADNKAPAFDYDTPKAQAIHDEDKEILKYDPGFKNEKINVMPVDSLFE